VTTTAGFYWHLHHEFLVEWCYDYDERADYVRNHKPSNERETRLTWFTPVIGVLPEPVNKAAAEYDKAMADYDKAGANYVKAVADYVKAVADYVKAVADYVKARDDYNKAVANYNKALRDNMPALEALHAAEHPGCPWDGKTLVFPKEVAP
jgi:tetratricopeptide (TPR) repeat protein